jgi:hypothetical protein
MLLPSRTATAAAAVVGADPDLLEYAGSLMQDTLLQVARAADDLVIVFGVSQCSALGRCGLHAARCVAGSAALCVRGVLVGCQLG